MAVDTEEPKKKKKPADDEPEETGDADADLDDLFDESDITGDQETPEAPPEMPPETDANLLPLLQEVAAALAEKGMMLDHMTDSDPKSFLEHLLTAIKTHTATEGKADGGDDDLNPDEGAAPSADAGSAQMPKAEPQYISMSRYRVLERQSKKLEAEIAARREADLIRDIDVLAKADMIDDATAQRWKEKFAAKRMSLAADTDSDLRALMGTIQVMLDQAKRKKLVDPLLMSRTPNMVPRPDWGGEEDKKKIDDELAEMFTTRREKNGKP